MRVLMTGHRGYIGSVAAPLMASGGHEVIGLDSGLYDDCGVRRPLPATELRKDVRDADAADLEGIDAVVHLAALCNDPPGDLAPSLTAAINYQASVPDPRLPRRFQQGARPIVQLRPQWRVPEGALQVYEGLKQRGIHGGSLRVSVVHGGREGARPRVAALLAEEQAWGVDDLAFYEGFAERVSNLKTELCTLLRTLKEEGKRLAGYGAAAIGSTLLNYMTIRVRPATARWRLCGSTN